MPAHRRRRHERKRRGIASSRRPGTDHRAAHKIPAPGRGARHRRHAHQRRPGDAPAHPRRGAASCGHLARGARHREDVQLGAAMGARAAGEPAPGVLPGRAGSRAAARRRRPARCCSRRAWTPPSRAPRSRSRASTAGTARRTPTTCCTASRTAPRRTSTRRSPRRPDPLRRRPRRGRAQGQHQGGVRQRGARGDRRLHRGHDRRAWRERPGDPLDGLLRRGDQPAHQQGAGRRHGVLDAWDSGCATPWRSATRPTTSRCSRQPGAASPCAAPVPRCSPRPMPPAPAPSDGGVADVLEHFGLTGTGLAAEPSMR